MPLEIIEFTVVGVPHSVNSSNSRARREWMTVVQRDAESAWSRSALSRKAQTGERVEVVITTCFSAIPRDVDNVIKPILDALRRRQPSESAPTHQVSRRKPGSSQEPFFLFDDDAMVERVVSQRIDLNRPLTLHIRGEGADANLLAALDIDEPEFVHISVKWGGED